MTGSLALKVWVILVVLKQNLVALIVKIQALIVLNHVTSVINVRKVKGVPKILSPTVCHISLGAFQIRAATRSANKSQLHLIE